MSRTPAGMDAGLKCVSALVAQRRWQRARKLLDSLLTWRPMTVSRELELRKRSAEVAYRMCHFRRVRRHCRLALRLDPTAAEFHTLYARACEADPLGCPRRAVRHYRKAMTLNAQEPLSRASLGRAMVRVDEINSGIKVMKAAAEKAPTDPEVLQIVSEGLCEAGRSEEAFGILSKARFLAPRSRELEVLWNQAKYDMAAQRQSRPDSRKSRIPAVPPLRLYSDESPAAYRSDTGRLTPKPHLLRFRPNA